MKLKSSLRMSLPWDTARCTGTSSQSRPMYDNWKYKTQVMKGLIYKENDVNWQSLWCLSLTSEVKIHSASFLTGKKGLCQHWAKKAKQLKNQTPHRKPNLNFVVFYKSFNWVHIFIRFLHFSTRRVIKEPCVNVCVYCYDIHRWLSRNSSFQFSFI